MTNTTSSRETALRVLTENLADADVLAYMDGAQARDHQRMLAELMLNELIDTGIMKMVKPDRPPFPVETFDGSCPACGKEDTIQSVCLATHVWSGVEVKQGACILSTEEDMRMEDDCTMHENEASTLSFEGGFDWMDDSVDAHISCYECDTEWAEPGKLEYR